jgi:hypothetical protein
VCFFNFAIQGGGFVGIIVQSQQLLIRDRHICGLSIGRTTPDEKAKYVRYLNLRLDSDKFRLIVKYLTRSPSYSVL